MPCGTKVHPKSILIHTTKLARLVCASAIKNISLMFTKNDIWTAVLSSILKRNRNHLLGDHSKDVHACVKGYNYLLL